MLIEELTSLSKNNPGCNEYKTKRASPRENVFAATEKCEVVEVGIKFVKREEVLPLPVRDEEPNRCLTSKVSSEYIVFKTLNISDDLLMKSLTESNSTIGLCKNSWIAR